MGYRLGEWEKPPLDELMHYGVPGMKWGHHKRVDSVEVTQARKAVKETTKNFIEPILNEFLHINHLKYLRLKSV